MSILDDILGERYVPEQFWQDAGRLDWHIDREWSPAHVEQAAVIRDVLADLDWTTVLDVGCGPARLGRIIHEIRPDVRYTGLDISDKALEVARHYLPDAELIQGSIVDIDLGKRTWDLVITSEVLMHIEPIHIEAVIAKLQRIGSRVLAVEWVIRGAPPERIAGWNWAHDYTALGLGEPVGWTGQQGIFLWEP